MDLEEALRAVDAAVFTKTRKHLTPVEATIFRGAWQGKTYEVISRDSQGRYKENYLKRDVGPKFWRLLSEVLEEDISKTNFKETLERRIILTPRQELQPKRQTASGLDIQKGQISSGVRYAEPNCSSEHPWSIPVLPEHNPEYERSEPHKDWGEAVDYRVFQGREEELERLSYWIRLEREHKRCRLLALLGIGGIGKTLLAVKLAVEVQHDFEYIIWRSLHDAPVIDSILTDLISFFSGEAAELPDSEEGKISLLMKHLRSRRCLILLDGFDAILEGSQVGQYREHYDGYSKLLRRVGEERHKSCLILTSREKPKEFSSREGDSLWVKSWQMTGLKPADAKKILQATGLDGSEEEYEQLIERYSGNPLNLKLAAIAIQDLFKNNIAEFLAQETLVFGGIQSILEKQFDRLSDFSKKVIYWIAIHREPISLPELQEDMVLPIPKRKLLEALQALERRSLIENVMGYDAVRFTLQPAVREYVTDRLIEEFCEQFNGENSFAFDSRALINTHALIKAQVDDSIRSAQVHCILQPVKDCLINILGSAKKVEERLKQALKVLQDKYPLELGYAGGNLVNLLSQALSVSLTGQDFSHLTLWQTYLRDIELHSVNLSNCNLEKSVFTEILENVLSIACSASGEFLAAGDADGRIHLWNLATGSKLLSWDGHASWVRSVAFSPDSQILASSSNDRTVKLWDVQTGQCFKTSPDYKDWVRSIAFSPDGRLLAIGGDEYTVKLWNLSTGECTPMLLDDPHTDRVRSVAFSPDGRLLASGSDDTTVKLWDVKARRCLKTFEGHSNRVRSVAFSPNSQLLVSGSDDKTVKLWNTNTGQSLSLVEHSDRVRSVAFSPNGQLLVSGSDDKTVKLWNVAGQCLNTLSGHYGRVQSVAFSADGQILASGGDDRSLRLWRMPQGNCFKAFYGYSNGVRSIAFSSEDSLISGGDEQSIKVWNLQTGEVSLSLMEHSGRIRAVAASPENQLLATAGDEQVIRLWHSKTGECLQLLKGHTHWIRSIAFSPNGQILASGGDDQTIRLWSVETGECLRILKGHTHWIRSIAFSPNGQILASGGDDQTVRLWNVRTGDSTLLGRHQHRIQAVAFSPEGRTLASGSDDQAVMLWEINSNELKGEHVTTLSEHTHGARAIAFSPNGQLLASASHNNLVKLWDLETKQILKTLVGHSGRVRSLAFSNTGAILASSSQDGSIKLWSIETETCLRTLSSPRLYEKMDITKATGLTEAQKDVLLALGAIDRKGQN